MSVRRTALILALLSGATEACATSAPAPNLPMMQATGTWQANLGLDEGKPFTELPDQGFRLVDVSGYSLAGRVRYASLWSFAEVHGWEERRDLDAASLLRANEEAATRGMVIARLRTFDVPDGARFAAIWELGAPGSRTLRLGLKPEQVARAASDEHVLDLAGYASGGEERFAEIVTPRSADDALSIGVHPTLDGGAFDALIRDLAASGGRPWRIAARVVDGVPRFSVLTSNAPGSPWISARDLDAADYQRRVEDMIFVGYHTAEIAAYVVDGAPRFAVTWMQ